MVYAFEDFDTETQGRQELDAWRTRQPMVRSQATPDLAARVVALHQTWPDIEPGVLVGMAMAGIDPDSDIARQLEQRSVEKAAGHGFHSPGEVVDAQTIAREQEQEEQPPWHDPVSRNVRAGVRGAFMGMETAFDEVSRRATSALVAFQDPDQTFSSAMELSTPSQGALLLGDEFGWEDLGDGFIPGGAVRERQEELKQRLTLDGEWMSPGRALARFVTEPGTKPFNFLSGLADAGSRIVLDPATYALGGASKLRQGAKLFSTDSAVVRGIRNSTDEKYAHEWWLHGRQAQLRQSLVDVDDPYEVWRRLGGPQGKVDRDTARLIADARTPGALDEVVMPRLGPQGIAEKPVGSVVGRGLGRLTDPFFADDVGAVHGFGYRVRRGTDNVRLMQWMPDATIDIADPDRAMTTLHRFLQGIKATDDEAASIMGRAFRVGADGASPESGNWMELAKDLTELAAEKALRDSVGTRRATAAAGSREAKRAAKLEQNIKRDIGRAFERKHDEIVSYFKSEAPSPRGNTMTWVDGSEVDLSKIPSLTTEFLSSNIPLPDMQQVRRHIGGYARAMAAMNDLPRPLVEGLVDGASGLMTAVWKPMVLLRGAYIARVVGEEQMRMAATGLDSAFRHPFSYMAYLTGRKGGVGLTGDTVEDMLQFQMIAQRKGGGWIGRKPGEKALKDRVKYERRRSDGSVIDDQAFVRAWSDDLSMLINDPVSSMVARDGVDNTHAFLMSAKGKRFRNEIAEAEQWREVASSPEALRRYLDGAVLPRIEEKTRGNADLLQAIASGRLDGSMVRFAGPTGGDAPSSLHKGLAARLDEVGIEEVWGRRFVTTSRRGSSDENLLATYNTAVDFLADIIMSKPTNYMSRFPTWKQGYVRAIEQQLGFMDAATQRAVLRWAGSKEGANLSRTEMARLQRTASAGHGTTITDLEAADLIARNAATRDTRKLLYELTELGQLSDATRAAMPFAEAWKEILTQWTRIARDRPQTIRRAQQVVEGARGAGVFYQDPSTGEEMFAYPGGKFVSRALLSGAADSTAMQTALSIPGVGAAATVGLGVAGAFMDEQPAEFDLAGNVAGLNLFAGSVLPGLGPAVTLPAAQIVPDRPQFDWVRDNILFPFGEPDVSEGFFESMLPAWFDKLRTGWMKDPDTDRIYANSVFDVAKALMATGEYSTGTPEEIDRLLAVAKERAKGLWLVRGASQFVVPTGPQAAFRVQDLEGEWWPYQVVATEFHRLNQGHGEQEAVEEFLATFGTDLITLVQSKSREVVHRPTTAVGDDWIQANPELATSYRTTVGYLAPDDPTGEFSFRAYQRHFDEGTREQLRPDQMVWLSNNLLGRFAYANATQTIDQTAATDADARQGRALARAHLMERFPGFGSHLGVSERPRVEQQIGELEQMVSDPRVEDMDAVAGLRRYLDARRRANLMVRATATRSTTFRSSAETAWIRHYLRDQAAQAAADHPEFIPMWDRVLQRELADDVAEPGQMIGAAHG